MGKLLKKFYIDKEHFDFLKEQSKTRDQSMSAIVRKMIDGYQNKLKK